MGSSYGPHLWLDLRHLGKKHTRIDLHGSGRDRLGAAPRSARKRSIREVHLFYPFHRAS